MVHTLILHSQGKWQRQGRSRFDAEQLQGARLLKTKVRSGASCAYYGDGKCRGGERTRDAMGSYFNVQRTIDIDVKGWRGAMRGYVDHSERQRQRR